MNDETRGELASRTRDRRGVLLNALAVTGGAVAALLARGETALATHDGTDVFHVRRPNEGGTTPTQLIANVDLSALGTPGATAPPGGALMIFNGDGTTPGKGWAIFGHGNPGAIGGINGNAGGPGIGVLGSANKGNGVEGRSIDGAGVSGESQNRPGVQARSQQGPGVEASSQSAPGLRAQSRSGPGISAHSEEEAAIRAHTRSAREPAIVGQWAGDPSITTPHSGVFGSTTGGAPGIHGVGRSLGVFGEAREAREGGQLTDGTGVFGESGTGGGVRGRSVSGHGVGGGSDSGPGVFGRSKSGPGVEGRSETGPGVIGRASLTGGGVEGFASTRPQGAGEDQGRPGVIGNASASNSGVAGQSQGGGPGVHGIQAGPSGLAVRATAEQAGAIGLQTVNQQGGLALDVVGKARFKVAGLATVPADADSHTVSAPVDPATSLVFATLLARPGVRLRKVSPPFVEIGAGSFTVRFEDKVKNETDFAWMAVERGA